MKKREIKFRAWDIRKKQMVYDALLVSEKGQLVTVNESYFNSDFSFFDGCKWMQYLGMKDSTKWEDLTEQERSDWLKSGKTMEEWDGREIYDGDIYELEFSEDNATFGPVNVEYMKFLRNISNAELRRLTVIGNIYENPEL